jgi:hypothetical protein
MTIDLLTIDLMLGAKATSPDERGTNDIGNY